MTTRRLVSPEAEEELAEAAIWYEKQRPGLGVDLVVVVDAALDAIVEAPTSHPLWRPDFPCRTKVLERFPFVVFFRLDGELVVVVAIAHAKRRPGYWLDRDR